MININGENIYLQFIVMLFLKLKLCVRLRKAEEDFSHRAALKHAEEQRREAGHPRAPGKERVVLVLQWPIL